VNGFYSLNLVETKTTIMEKKDKDLKKQQKGIQDNAINKKGNESDGREINHQVQDKREKHQPRDNA